MLIEFDRVSYTYPCSHNPALDSLNLIIPQHRRCALIGRNGCGKSTLFRLANGLYRPDRGIIRFSGKPLGYDRSSLQQLRQRVGLVFQDPEQQLVAPTVATDLSYGLCNLELPEKEIATRVQGALQAFDLTTLADLPINYLSLGQKKRVSLANVMVLQPQLLLLDEPTAYLDPSQVRNLLSMLQKVEQQGTTIVVATHDLNFVYAWADWILVMGKGRLILEGPPLEVFTQTETLQELGLGIPLAMELVRDITQLIESKGTIAASDFPELLSQFGRFSRFE